MTPRAVTQIAMDRSRHPLHFATEHTLPVQTNNYVNRDFKGDFDLSASQIGTGMNPALRQVC
jgi:hypothetical protein